MARESKSAMEAETRLTSGAAARSHAGTGPHRGMQKCFYPGGLENPYREKPGQRNAEESRELEADQRPGLGKGLPQVAGRARLEGIAQKHHYAEPSCFYRAPDQRLAKLLHSLGTFWTGALSPGRFPRGCTSPPHPSSSAPLSWDAASCPRELPPGLCPSNKDGTGVCLQDQNMAPGMLCNGGLPTDHGRAGGAEQPWVVVSWCCTGLCPKIPKKSRKMGCAGTEPPPARGRAGGDSYPCSCLCPGCSS